MKNFTQKAIALILIFALTALTGCSKDNTPTSDSALNSSSLLSSPIDHVSSDFFESSEVESGDYSSSAPFFESSSQASSTGSSASEKSPSKAPSEIPPKNEVPAPAPSDSNKLFKGLWISYYELPFWGKNEATAKEDFLNMMRLAVKQGYNAVFCHVRANADAFYPSKYFPFALQLTGTAGKNPGYDPLKIMIWAAKQCGLEFHAWINPYRVSNTSANPDNLAAGHIAKGFLSDGSERAVAYGNGIYFNPASADVQRLILNGIREILDNYSVDGIHFDDYFYPQKIGTDFDDKHYGEYLKSNKSPLSLEDWRRANVNALVSAVYRLCHSKKVLFGISPAGNISFDNSHDNYNYLFIDTALWMREEGYVDYILPQLYFGYNHPKEKARYTYLLNIWSALPKHKNLKLFIGLGAYKMNADCDDKEEWHNEADLMARQATDAINCGAGGIAVFSYTATSLESEHNSLQIKNMFNAVNAFKKS